MKNIVKIGYILFLFLVLPILFIKPIQAKSGCCSHHGGVCGCDTNIGSQVCCDGSYSPTCGCTIVKKPTPTPIKVVKTNPLVQNKTIKTMKITIPQVKKSGTGICHQKGSTYYNQTLKFTSYNSLQECLKSGGRLPKR